MFRFRFDRTSGWGKHIGVFDVHVPAKDGASAKVLADFLASRLNTKEETFTAVYQGEVE
jgi:hypothetical protein